MSQCRLCKSPDAADLLSSANVVFHQRQAHFKEILLYQQKNESIQFPGIQAGNVGPMWSREAGAPGAAVCWPSPGPPQARADLALWCCWSSGMWCSHTNASSCSGVHQEKTAPDCRCSSTSSAAAAISHHKPPPPGWPLILLGVCLLLEELWTQERPDHLKRAAHLVSVQPFQQRISELQEENNMVNPLIQD